MSRSSHGGGERRREGGCAARRYAWDRNSGGPKLRNSRPARPAPAGAAITRGGGHYVGVKTSSETPHFDANKKQRCNANAASHRRHRRRPRRPPGSLITMSRAAASRRLRDALITGFGCWTSGNNDPIEPRPTITAQFNDSPSAAAKLKRLRKAGRAGRTHGLRATTGDQKPRFGNLPPALEISQLDVWAKKATCATFA